MPRACGLCGKTIGGSRIVLRKGELLGSKKGGVGKVESNMLRDSGGEKEGRASVSR